MNGSVHGVVRAPPRGGRDTRRRAESERPIPTLRLFDRTIEFPALEEVMPLLYFGILALLIAAIMGFTQVALFIGRLPFWWYLLGLGLIAVAGALVAAHARDDEEFREGDTVGPDLIAVRTEDWTDWQTTKELLPAWVEATEPPPTDPLTELETLHDELDQARVAQAPAPRGEIPVAAASAAKSAERFDPSETEPDPALSEPLPRVEEIISHVPPSTTGGSPKAAPLPSGDGPPSSLMLEKAGAVKKTARPRCASCDRDSVPMDPVFRCTSCGRGLCLECASPYMNKAEAMRCPVCRTLDTFASAPSPSKPSRPKNGTRGPPAPDAS